MSKQIKMTSKDGVTLYTGGKYVTDDIHVIPDESLLGTPEVVYPNEAIKYYKENRNINYPYFPLPSEMEEEQDTIYMLYDANNYFCAFTLKVTFTNCLCTIYKYMNTTLVSESNITLTSNTAQYLTFSEEDEDYSTYNYVLVKLQGNITKLDYGASPKFNGDYVPYYVYGNLIEVSGKCESCELIQYNQNTGDPNTNANLEFYSFYGINNSSWRYMFKNAFKLKLIVDISLKQIPTSMQNAFNGCESLLRYPKEIDVSLSTDNDYFLQKCFALEEVTLNLDNTTKVKSLLYQCKNLKKINIVLNNDITDLSSLMYECVRLSKAPTIYTDNVTNANGLFSGCVSLEEIPDYNFSKVNYVNNLFHRCVSMLKMNIKNIAVSFSLSDSTLMPKEELVNVLSNCQVITTTQTLTLGSKLLAKLEGVYVKETGVEQYEGITCRPCVICESTDEGAMLATEYFTGKGWTLA